MRGYAVVCANANHHLFEIAYVSMHIASFRTKIENRISDDLSGTVIRHITAAASFMHLDAVHRKLPVAGNDMRTAATPDTKGNHRRMLKKEQQVGNMVLAPGGGWITNPDVVGLLRPPGRLIYLRVQPETALKRLGTRRSLRPLLSRPDPGSELERLYDQRRTAYETADDVVDTELYSLQRVIEKVMELASSVR